MNIFLPYENIEKSIQSLDDDNLIYQIKLLKIILGVNYSDSEKFGKHPVVQHYRKYLGFVSYYGFSCCSEYEYRFGKMHYDFPMFYEFWKMSRDFNYVPIYCEFSEKQKKLVVMTGKDIYKKFQDKLIMKWNNYESKWTKRNAPEFYPGNKKE